jgi:hypothetical protein
MTIKLTADTKVIAMKIAQIGQLNIDVIADRQKQECISLPLGPLKKSYLSSIIVNNCAYITAATDSFINKYCRVH